MLAWSFVYFSACMVIFDSLKTKDRGTSYYHFVNCFLWWKPNYSSNGNCRLKFNHKSALLRIQISTCLHQSEKNSNYVLNKHHRSPLIWMHLSYLLICLLCSAFWSGWAFKHAQPFTLKSFSSQRQTPRAVLFFLYEEIMSPSVLVMIIAGL